MEAYHSVAAEEAYSFSTVGNNLAGDIGGRSVREIALPVLDPLGKDMIEGFPIPVFYLQEKGAPLRPARLG